jgi:tRNA (guanosine-2'-O-)-methyltransferase
MKRVISKERDVFRPRGQLLREMELATANPTDVIRVLEGRLSEERKRRIDVVLEHRTRRLSVAIEGVIDPHNTAAVIRTSDAFGLQTVHVIERDDRKFFSSRKVTQGAHKWVDLGFWKDPAVFAKKLKGEGKRVLIAAANGDLNLGELNPLEPMVLVFGNEHEGISSDMQAVADGAFRIPMFGFVQSMNVSVAAAIAIASLRKDGVGDLSSEEREILRARFYMRAIRAGYDIVMLDKGFRR